MRIGGQPLDEYLKDNNIDNLDRDEIETRVKKAGAEIIAMKGATFYGVAAATCRVVEAYLDDQRAVLAVSHVFADGEYEGLENVSVSLPCMIDGTGLVKVVNATMSESEKESILTAAARLRDFTQEVMADSESAT